MELTIIHGCYASVSDRHALRETSARKEVEVKLLTVRAVVDGSRHQLALKLFRVTIYGLVLTVGICRQTYTVSLGCYRSI